MIFGRNYDWVTDAGMVCTNLRGLSKTSMKAAEGSTISLVSQYGSITFNQYGKEFPTGGMNEKGLVVELMWLDETKYPKPDARPAVDVLQWVQYQLDNCATIDDVVATDKKVRIAAVGNTPLHYLVADAKGNAATIEFLDGKMLVHKGSDLPFPVLTNDDYASSLEQTKIATASEAGNRIDIHPILALNYLFYLSCFLTSFCPPIFLQFPRLRYQLTCRFYRLLSRFFCHSFF